MAATNVRKQRAITVLDFSYAPCVTNDWSSQSHVVISHRIPWNDNPGACFKAAFFDRDIEIDTNNENYNGSTIYW